MVNLSYSKLKLLMPYYLFIYQILVNSVLFKRPVVACYVYQMVAVTRQLRSELVQHVITMSAGQSHSWHGG